MDYYVGTVGLLYSGRNGWSRCVLLFRVHEEEDNFSIVDEMAGPNVSFIQRVHCINYKEEDNLSIVDEMAGHKI